MAYVLSALDEAGTPVLVVQRSRSEPSWRQVIRSAYFAPVGPPPVTETGAIGLQFAITLARGSSWPTYTTADNQIVGVTIAEKHQSRQLKASTDGMQLTRVFFVHGTYDPATARDIGPQVGDQDDVLTDFYVEERTASPYAAGGGEADIVLLTVTYSQPHSPQNGGGGSEGTFGYEFGSESEHIDRALAQVHYGGDAERISDLINVTEEEVQGLEINAPIIDLTEEHVFGEAAFSPTIRRALRDQIQKTNAEAFREFAAGEVLFVGASARKQAKRWYVTFQFRVRRNVDHLPFTTYSTRGVPTEQDVVKLGWQYLWVESIRLPFAADPTKIRVVPRAVHVATVYDSVDFSVLGIGTDPLP
jgi:hypothetical protein